MPRRGSPRMHARFLRDDPLHRERKEMSVKRTIASAFLFSGPSAGWRLGLIGRPRLGRLMIPGGHVAGR
jgi:hypothetical protein